MDERCAQLLSQIIFSSEAKSDKKPRKPFKIATFRGSIFA